MASLPHHISKLIYSQTTEEVPLASQEGGGVDFRSADLLLPDVCSSGIC